MKKNDHNSAKDMNKEDACMYDDEEEMELIETNKQQH